MIRKILKAILGIFIFAALFVIPLYLYPEWKWGGHLQTSLEPQYVTDAQELMENPLPIPNFITIAPSPGSVITTGERIDIGIYSERFSASPEDIFEWTRIYINHVRIAPFTDVNAEWGGPLMPKYQNVGPNFYLNPQLQPGFHLFEIRVGTSITTLLNPGQALSYTWAYQVK